MTQPKFASEVEMMQPLVEHFRGNAREMRQNLPVVLHGKLVFPDLVIVRRDTGDTEVFEGKQHLTDEVIAQAMRWRRYCHRSYVVVPATDRESREHRTRRVRLSKMNLGLILIRYDDQRPEFQIQFNLYRNAKPDTELLLAAMEQAPPPSTDKPAGAASVQPSAALQQFGRVIAYIERHGEMSAMELVRAGVLRHSDRMRLILAIDRRELDQLVYTGPHGVFQRATSEVTA